MIKIDCLRDKNGFYDIDNISKKDYKICFRIFSDRKNSENFWCIPKDGEKAPFIVKFMKKPGYIFALYSELIVSELCKQNKVPCANIDVAKSKDNFCVVSEDVTFDADERFDCYELARLSGAKKDALSRENRDQNFFVENLYNMAQRACKVVPGLKLDKDFLLDLYKLAFIDLMVSQEDRNPSNILFTIKKSGFRRILSVAPLFDNEYSLSFMRLIPRFKGQGIEPFPAITTENAEDNISVAKINYRTYECSQYVTPILGIKSGLTPFVFPVNKGLPGDWNLNCAISKNINASAYSDIAKVFLENEKFAKFCTYFVVNAQEIGKKIYEEQGFKIPDMYLNLAENIILDNYKRFAKFVNKERRSQRKRARSYEDTQEVKDESSPLL